MDAHREPCPSRIIVDVGMAYSMGAIGGSIWHGGKACYRAPRGQRVSTLMNGIRMRGPVTGGSFGAWGGLFSTCDCALVYIRRKEDHMNSIASGALTSAILSARSGMKSAVRAGILGGALLALMEGVMLSFMRYTAEPVQFNPPPPIEALEDDVETKKWYQFWKSSDDSSRPAEIDRQEIEGWEFDDDDDMDVEDHTDMNMDFDDDDDEWE